MTDEVQLSPGDDQPQTSPWPSRLGRVELVIGVLCAGLMVLLLVGVSATSFASNDFPALVKYGELAIEKGRFARFSDFAIDQESDKPDAMHHQWLLELILYTAWSALGAVGIWIGKGCVLALVALFMFLGTRGRIPIWVWALAAAVVFLSLIPRIMPRGDFVSLAFLACTLWLLLDAQKTGKWSRLYFLIPAHLAWINFHPLGSLGPAVFGLFILEVILHPWLVKKQSFREILGERKHALFALAGCCLAVLITPYGPTVILSTVRAGLGSDPEMVRIMESISEFSPTGALFNTEYLIILKTFLVVCGVLLVAGLLLRTVRPWTVPFFGIMAAYGLLHYRMIGFAAVTGGVLVLEALPGLGELAKKVRPRHWERFRPWAVAVAVLVAAWMGALAVDVVDGSLFIRNADVRRFGVVRANTHYPWKAVDYVRERGLRGHCFNNYDVGSFLAWQLPEGCRVFIDTQFLYSNEFYFQYSRTLEGHESLDKLLGRYDIRFVLLRHPSPEAAKVFMELYRNPGWTLVFLDECGVVFVPRTAENEALVKTDDIRLESADPIGLLSEGDGTHPRGIVSLADFLLRIGLVSKSEFLYAKALEKDHRFFSAWHNLGVIRARRGDAEGALECFLMAIRTNSYYDKPRESLRELLESGDFDPTNKKVQEAWDWVD